MDYTTTVGSAVETTSIFIDVRVVKGFSDQETGLPVHHCWLRTIRGGGRDDFCEIKYNVLLFVARLCEIVIPGSLELDPHGVIFLYFYFI